MENLVIFAKKKFTMDKFLTQVKVTTESNVKKVLNVSARSVVFGCECANNIVSCTGKLIVNVIYVNTDNMLAHSEVVSDFIEKSQTNVALSDIFALDDVNVEFYTESSSEVLCNIAHNITISGIYKYEIQDLSKGGENLVFDKKEINTLKLLNTCEDNFVVAEESDSNIKNMNILSSNANIYALDVSCGVDKIIVDGKIVADVIYEDGETISNYIKEFEFKQEIQAQGVVPNMLVCTELKVKSITITPEDKDDKTNIIFAFDVYAKGYCYEECNVQVASDMFSLSNEVQATYDFVEAKNFHSQKLVNDIVTTSTNVADIENFDDLLGVFEPKIKILALSEDNEKVYFQGEVSAFAIYKAGEEYEKLIISSPTNFEFAKENNNYAYDAIAAAQISSYKVKAGKELEVIFKVDYSIETETIISEKFIRSFEEKQEKSENLAGIKVYVTQKGETIFEVAKALSVKPEIIVSQNQVDNVFEQGEKIYVYSPINLL